MRLTLTEARAIADHLGRSNEARAFVPKCFAARMRQGGLMIVSLPKPQRDRVLEYLDGAPPSVADQTEQLRVALDQDEGFEIEIGAKPPSRMARTGRPL